MNAPSYITIVAALNYSDISPSFGLAVGICSDNNNLWVQIRDGISQKIVGFECIEDTLTSDAENIVSLQVSIGDAYIHAFFDDGNRLYLDTASNLSLVLRAALRRHSTSLPIQLSISEQLQDLEAERRIRARLSDAVLSNFGPGAQQAYNDSLLRSRFWGLLEESSVNRETLEKIRRSRGRITAYTDIDGTITIEAPGIDPNELTTSLEEIYDRLAVEFSKGLSRIDKPGKVDLSRVRHLHDPTEMSILEAVYASPRQEERVAVLMRALLIHPEVGYSALRRVEGRTKFEANSYQFLRQEISGRENPKILEMLVARCVDRLYSDSFPLQRGKLLYYMAEHLRDFPIVSDAIRSRLNRANSNSVSMYRSATEELLRGT